uniref:Protein odr-4 homolog n=1 Tax=Strigamia maritima TaxID=126957 RepID=T1J7P0_STRMM
MGRLIFAEENVKSSICSLSSLKESLVGLVIGQSTTQKDIVCHLAPLPKDINTSGNEKKSQKTNKAAEAKRKNWEDFDEKWIVQQARQVVRMLPGGLNVLGIFVVSPADALPAQTYQKVKQFLLAVFKFLDRHEFQISTNTVPDKVILHVCSASEKVVARSLDVSNLQNFIKPAEFKFQPNSTWHRLDCRVALDFSFPFNADQTTCSLHKQIHAGVLPFFSALKMSIVSVNGKIRKANEFLEEPKSKTKQKSKSKETVSSEKIHSVDVYMQQLSRIGDETACVIEDCQLKMQLRGTLQSRSYVHSRATVGEAEEAVRQDIIRSLIARCEIHCEDLLLIDEDQQDPNVVHEPPRRVFANLPGSDITVSDYLFPGEKARDSLAAYKELLGLDLTEDQVEFQRERLAEESDLQRVPSERGCLVPSTSDILSIPTTSKSTCNLLGVDRALNSNLNRVVYFDYIFLSSSFNRRRGRFRCLPVVFVNLVNEYRRQARGKLTI